MYKLGFQLSEWNRQAVKHKSDTSPVIFRCLLVLPLSVVFWKEKMALPLDARSSVYLMMEAAEVLGQSCATKHSPWYLKEDWVQLQAPVTRLARTSFPLSWVCRKNFKAASFNGLEVMLPHCFLVHSFMSCYMLPLLCDEFSLSPSTEWELLLWVRNAAASNVSCSPLDRACQSHPQRRAMSKSIRSIPFLGHDLYLRVNSIQSKNTTLKSNI